jgi:hypothetical protein
MSQTAQTPAQLVTPTVTVCPPQRGISVCSVALPPASPHTTSPINRATLESPPTDSRRHPDESATADCCSVPRRPAAVRRRPLRQPRQLASRANHGGDTWRQPRYRPSNLGHGRPAQRAIRDEPETILHGTACLAAEGASDWVVARPVAAAASSAAAARQARGDLGAMPQLAPAVGG